MPNTLTRTQLPAPLRTPLTHDGGLRIKPECGQHAGSVKYRMVYAKIRAGLDSGAIHPGIILTEVSAGSTGVALAYAGMLLGLRVEIHAYRNADPAKCALIEKYGARLHMHPAEAPMPELLENVRQRMKTGTHWHLNQYDRASTTAAYRDLAKETIEQLGRSNEAPPKIFACPVGTGGLIQGVGARLREAFPGMRIVAAEPEPGGSIDGMRDTGKFHMGARDPYVPSFPDERITVPAPRGRRVVPNLRLGESASAVVEGVRSRGWTDVLIIAPD